MPTQELSGTTAQLADTFTPVAADPVAEARVAAYAARKGVGIPVFLDRPLGDSCLIGSQPSRPRSIDRHS
jgi:hypothetical protein